MRRWADLSMWMLQRLWQYRKRHRRGFTLIEMLLAMAILATLSAIGLPRIQEAIEKAKVARAIGDILAVQSSIDGLMKLPPDLAAVGHGGMLDPWGHPYVYNPFSLVKGGIATARKDRFLVPLNSEYDLYSMGRDGGSKPPLNAPVSKDDILRANDGGYVGLAEKY